MDIPASKAPKGHKELMDLTLRWPLLQRLHRHGNAQKPRKGSTAKAPGTIPMTPRKTTVRPESLMRSPRQPPGLTRTGQSAVARNMCPATPILPMNARSSLPETRKIIGKRKTILKANAHTVSPSAKRSPPN
jgi:hypothetical protein